MGEKKKSSTAWVACAISCLGSMCDFPVSGYEICFYVTTAEHSGIGHVVYFYHAPCRRLFHCVYPDFHYIKDRFMSYFQTCSNGHHIHTWSSQPKIKNLFAGNFLISAAVLISGNNFKKIALLASFMNLAMVGTTSHQRVQRVFTVPVINSYYEDMMQKTLAKYREKDIVIAGK